MPVGEGYRQWAFRILGPAMLVGLLASAVGADPQDLLYNGGFETGGTPPVAWTVQYGQLATVASPRHPGNLVAELRNTTDARAIARQVVPIRPGAAYTLNAYALQNDAAIAAVYLRVTWYRAADGTGDDLSVAESTTHIIDRRPDFRSLSTGTIVAPAIGGSAAIELVLQPVSTTMGAVYFDDVSFTGEPPLPTSTATASPTRSPSSTSAATPSSTSSPTASPSRTATASRTPTRTTTPTRTATPRPATPTPTPTPDLTAAEPGAVIISEVLYDPLDPGNDRAAEWVELHNPGPGSVRLAGWTLGDGEEDDPLPTVTIPAGGFSIVAATDAFLTQHPDLAGRTVLLADGSIGNGLANTGDSLTLRDGPGRVVDALSYGRDTSVLNPPLPTVQPGQSLERRVLTARPAASGDFAANPSPGPGRPPEPRPATPIPTAPTAASSRTPTPAPPTPTPESSAAEPGAVIISEFLYDPAEPGNDQAGEWVELHNPGPSAVRLAGWTLGDGEEDDPVPTLAIPAGGFAIVAATDTFLTQHPDLAGRTVLLADGSIGNGLANTGDSLTLRDGPGRVVDALSYGRDTSVLNPPLPTVQPGQSLERPVLAARPATSGDFTANPSPDPGRPAEPRPATPIPTAPTAASGRTATPAPGTPTPEPSAAEPGAIIVSELLYDPAEPGNDQAGEWVELHNPGPSSARLAGWTLVDGEEDDPIPTLAIPAGGFAIVAATNAFLARYPDLADRTVILADGSIGNGLANTGDSLTLRDGRGRVVDALSYGRDTSVLSPALPAVQAGQSLERHVLAMRPAASGDFAANGSPGPGQPPQPQVEPGPPPPPNPEADLERHAHLLMPIAAAREMKPGTKLYLFGQITVPPRLAERQRLWLQDGSAGIAAQIRHGNFPELSVDDWVMLIGEAGERRGERDVRVFAAYDSVRVRPGLPPAPVDLDSSAVGEETEGRLARVRGRLVRDGSTLAVQDGSGRARLRLPPDIPEPSAPAVSGLIGKQVQAVGVISQWDTRPPYDAGYRVILRSAADLTLADEVQLLTGVDKPSEAARQPAFADRPTTLPRAGEPGILEMMGAGVALLASGVVLKRRAFGRR